MIQAPGYIYVHFLKVTNRKRCVGRESFKSSPYVVPNWALVGSKRAHEEPKWSRNRPPGGPNGSRSTQNGHEEELRPPRCNSRVAKCTPRGRGAILGRFGGAQRGSKTRQIWGIKRDKMGTRFRSELGVDFGALRGAKT